MAIVDIRKNVANRGLYAVDNTLSFDGEMVLLVTGGLCRMGIAKFGDCLIRRSVMVILIW